jgi:hypothetical protein
MKLIVGVPSLYQVNLLINGMLSQAYISTMVAYSHHLSLLEIIRILGINYIVLTIVEVDLCPCMEVAFIMLGKSRHWIISIARSHISSITNESVEKVNEISITCSGASICVELNLQPHLQLVDSVVHCLSSSQAVACDYNFSTRVFVCQFQDISIYFS